jgi:signal transduction histidine kinase/ligand-binding sensor domain-containing protein
MFRKFLFIVLALSAAWMPLAAQYQIDFNVLTVDEGLSQNLVTTLLTDSRGFLWIGTDDGLNRYDGFENRIFRRTITDSTTIASNSIYSLAEAPDNRILVGHNFGYISIWYPEEARFRWYTDHVNSMNPENYDAVYDLSASEGGHIYALLNSGALRYNSTEDRFEPIPLPEEIPNLRAIYPEADSTLLLFAFDRTIHRYHLASGRLEHLRNYTEKTLGAARDFTSLGNNLYAISLNENVYVYDAVSQHTIATTVFPEMPTATTYDGSRLWVTGLGISVYYWFPHEPGHEPVLVSPEVQYTITIPQIRTIEFSYDGILWMGTIGDGLSKLYDKSVWFGHLRSDVNSANAIINTSIRAIFPLSPHEILIGGYAGLELYDFRLMHTRALLGGDSGNSVSIPFSIIADKEHNSVIWIGTEGNGLLRMDISTGSYQRFILEGGYYESNLIHYVQWISDTELILATTAGLRIFDTQIEREVPMPSLAAYSDQHISFIVQFADNALYSGTLDGNLARIVQSGQGLILEELLTDELDKTRLISFTQDASGAYWLGTNNGVFHLDSEFRIANHYTTEAGLPNNTIYSVQFDKLGYLWMSTNLGISRMDTQTGQFTNFTNRDGLQSNEFNRTSYANYEGEIMYLGGVQGVNYFRPDQIASEGRTHQVYIESLSAPSGVYKVGATKVLHLPYKDSQVNVRFTSPVFYNPRASEFWYRFANIDTTWRRNPLQNELIIAGLQPGTYQLQLVRSSEAGLHQAPVSEIWFRIHAPFYMLWYVQLGAFVFIAGLVAVSINSYLQKLRNTIDMSRKYSRELMLFQDEERRRVAEALHDSIGSKLMLVKLSFRQVLMSVKDEFAEQKYQEINGLISETAREIREISQNIHPHLLEKIGFSKSLEALLESLKEMAQTRFTWSIDSVDDYLTAQEALLLYRLVQESITNVVKHARAEICHVSVKADVIQGILEIEVRDNGIGIPNFNRSEPAKTMGLRSFEERAAHLEAELNIESRQGEGTSVRLKKRIPSAAV